MLATPLVAGGGSICGRSRLAILLALECFGEVSFVAVLELSSILFCRGSDEKADILLCCGSEEKVFATSAAKRENQDCWESVLGAGTRSTDEVGLTVAFDGSKNQHRR